MLCLYSERALALVCFVSSLIDKWFIDLIVHLLYISEIVYRFWDKKYRDPSYFSFVSSTERFQRVKVLEKRKRLVIDLTSALIIECRTFGFVEKQQKL